LEQLGFFDPEAIDPKFKNVDAGAGTVDIEYNLVEKGSSQIELQGGYGGGGFIGTLGLSFNNFSVGNLFKKDAYKPFLWVMVKKYLYDYKQVPTFKPIVYHFLNHGLAEKSLYNLALHWHTASNLQEANLVVV
jgi:hypothetical protein